MLVDSRVSSKKFERELKRLEGQRRNLEGKGIFLLGSSSFPFIEVVLAARNPLRVAPAVKYEDLPPGEFRAYEMPALSARAVKARFDLADYDLQPPSLEFRDPWTDELLDYKTMFRAMEYEKNRKDHVVLLSDHPITHKPFLCIRGIREYHTHPQHSGDEWLRYRSRMSLFSILLSIWRVSVDLVRPHLIVSPTQMQTKWVADPKL